MKLPRQNQIYYNYLLQTYGKEIAGNYREVILEYLKNPNHPRYQKK